jgi:hypothetical protein
MSGPVYTYTPDTPQAANPQNNTTTTIRSNFQAINELVNVNHVGFNSSDVGKHNFVSLEFQDPIPTVQVSQLNLYCQATGSPNVAEIFYNYPDNSTIEQLSDQTVPITGTGTSFGDAAQGYCTFPSGVVMRWGQATLKGEGNTTVDFTIGTPAYTTTFLNGAVGPTTSGTATPMGLQLNGYISTTSMNPINVGGDPQSSSTEVDINYLWIGA